MIPIGSVLNPRNPSDPVVKVCGVAEPDKYCLAPTEFGSVFSLGYDEVSAAYDCEGFRVSIDPYNEAAEWARLSSEVYHRNTQELRRNARKAADLPSPEDVFRAAAAEEAAAAKKSRGRK
ncbi:MAG: hypothetical protein ACHQC8_03500 [Solirubrobacterales bacterium]